MRQEVFDFALLMNQMLDRNMHRDPQWPECSLLYLRTKLKRKVDQLDHRLHLKHGVKQGTPDAERLREQAAHVANYAMMIADILDERDSNG